MSLRAFTMPKWGIEMAEGLLARWGVKEGEAFERGAVLAEVETDKITNEIEAEAPGRFARLVAQEGETLPVGALLAVLADGDEGAAEVDAFIATWRPAEGSTAAMAGYTPPLGVTPAVAVAAGEAGAVAVAADARAMPDGVAISPRAAALAVEHRVNVAAIAGSGRNGRVTAQDVEQAARPPHPLPNGVAVDIRVPDEDWSVLASPSARRLARQRGVALAGLTPTGPRGRVCKADVAAALPSPSHGLTAAGPSLSPEGRGEGAAEKPLSLQGRGVGVRGDGTPTPMSPMRKAIARRLTRAWQTIPHFTLRARADARALLQLKAAAARFVHPKPSLNDLLIRACALALRDVPDANLQVEGDAIRLLPQADIAVAVATEKGLVTPVLRGADRMTLAAVAAATRALVDRARASKLAAEDMEGGGFSLSNLGPMGVTEFDAIINPPQGAILAVGAVHAHVLDVGGADETVPCLALSLACDHRAIDGALGGRLLAAIRRHIETPDAL